MWLTNVNIATSEQNKDDRPQGNQYCAWQVISDFLTLIDGTADHVLYSCYDMILIEGEGPHLAATGRQAMNSVQTNKVVF